MLSLKSCSSTNFWRHTLANMMHYVQDLSHIRGLKPLLRTCSSGKILAWPTIIISSVCFQVIDEWLHVGIWQCWLLRWEVRLIWTGFIYPIDLKVKCKLNRICWWLKLYFINSLTYSSLWRLFFLLFYFQTHYHVACVIPSTVWKIFHHIQTKLQTNILILYV